MTIRYPAKVKTDNKNILASGVDTLVLSLDVAWKFDALSEKEPLLFNYLDELKEKAKETATDYHGELDHPYSEPWPFSIKPHGTTGGYAWILSGSDFTYKIGNWNTPGPRPSVMIEIRSETLWHLGTEEAMKLSLGIIQKNQGDIVEEKLSRVDLCVDFLMPEELWTSGLLEYAVTRASDYAPYYHHKKLTGIRIGKGIISARLYDKPLEIAQQSKKIWMYDIWQLSQVPEGQKIIRLEFQMRREALKELGLNTSHDLIEKSANAWAYCTKEWLKFQDRPGLHHTQRNTLEWWKEIQDGFAGIQDAEPLVREKAIRADINRLRQQATGLITSLHAIKLEEKGIALDTPVSIQDCVVSYAEEVAKNSDSITNVQPILEQKRSKYHREKTSREERVHKMAHFFSDKC